jgi:hypothetical protein
VSLSRFNHRVPRGKPNPAVWSAQQMSMTPSRTPTCHRRLGASQKGCCASLSRAPRSARDAARREGTVGHVWPSRGAGRGRRSRRVRGCGRAEACGRICACSPLQEVRPMRKTHHPCHVTMRSPAPAKPWLASTLFVTLPERHATHTCAWPPLSPRPGHEGCQDHSATSATRPHILWLFYSFFTAPL